ncbi:MAG: phosphatidylglycerol lysyltransferase domain-containing protein [Gloeobacterales cyanobacterium]
MVGYVLPISKTLDHTHLITTKPCTDLAHLLKNYGFNTTSYLALEKDKEHYFSPTQDACISYVHHHKVCVVAGEPVCKPEVISEVSDEYLSHCQNHQEHPIFFEVSASALKPLQWLYQYGEKLYPFSSLYKFKAKFHPHWWESKYLAYQNLGIPEINALAFALMGKTPIQIAKEQINNLKAKI